MKRLLGVGRVSAYHRLVHESFTYLYVRVIDWVLDDGVASSMFRRYRSGYGPKANSYYPRCL